MLRHPVQLSSLAEDFKKLGLLREDAEETYTQSGAGTPAPQQRPGPSGKPAPNKNGSRTVGAQTDGDTDAGKDGNDTVPGHQGEPTGSGPTKPSLPTTPGAQKESINGGDPRRQRLRGEACPEGEKGKKGDDEDDDEKDEGVELTGTNKVQEALARVRGEKTEKTEKTEEAEPKVPSRLDQVAALIEDVNSIMESIDTSRRDDATRAFANSAIISEMLARGFAHFAEEYEDEQLAETAEAFGTLSEDAAKVAHALEEGEEIDAETLENEFRAQMDALMDGLDLYSDVVEADSEIEEEEEEEQTEEEETAAKGEEQTEEEEQQEEEVNNTPPGKATGGISSQRTESYFRHGKMGPSGKKGMKKEMKK